MYAIVNAPSTVSAMIQISVAGTGTTHIVQPDLTSSVHMNVAQHMSDVTVDNAANCI